MDGNKNDLDNKNSDEIDYIDSKMIQRSQSMHTTKITEKTDANDTKQNETETTVTTTVSNDINDINNINNNSSISNNGMKSGKLASKFGNLMINPAMLRPGAVSPLMMKNGANRSENKREIDHSLVLKRPVLNNTNRRKRGRSRSRKLEFDFDTDLNENISGTAATERNIFIDAICVLINEKKKKKRVK